MSPGAWTGPRLAVSAAIFQAGRVLLVRRSRGGNAGRWSLPGGHVEFGESLEAALRREIAEETTLIVTHLSVPIWIELLPQGDVTGHFVIAAYRAEVAADRKPIAGSDAADLRFVSLPAFDDLPVTPGLADVVEQLAAMQPMRYTVEPRA